jgi:hypothetical protein
MELASMLAGEPFTDHPRSVSPAIASFMRTYNDMVDSVLRQDLYSYAAKCVGTSSSREAERARGRRLIAWGDELWARRARWSLFDRFRRRDARDGREKSPEAAARYAIRSIRKISLETHAEVLALVDELIEIGRDRRVPASLELPNIEPKVAEAGAVR